MTERDIPERWLEKRLEQLEKRLAILEAARTPVGSHPAYVPNLPQSSTCPADCPFRSFKQGEPAGLVCYHERCQRRVR